MDDPENELEEFLASKPAWVRTVLQQGESHLAPENFLEWLDFVDAGLIEQYEQILRHIANEWKKYRDRTKREYGTIFGSLMVPKGSPGRPKSEAIRIEAQQLKNEGLSYAQIALRLNQKHGRADITRESVRKLLSRPSRQSAQAPSPDKTQN